MSYTRLIYAYIEHYQGAREVELCFDDRYHVHYDKDLNKLNVLYPNKDHIDGFWGDKICSFVVIVGENGSGKSSALRYILNSVSTKFCKEADENIIVLETEKELTAYTNKSIECRIQVKREFEANIAAFFYSALFSLPYHGDPAVTEKSEYIYNASEGFRLLQDYQDYCDADLRDFKQTLGNHMLGYDAQGKYRTSNLLADHYGKMKTYGLEPPRYVLVIPNKSGKHAVMSKYFMDEELPELPKLDINSGTSKKCGELAKFTYEILISYATNNRDIKTDTLEVLKKWVNKLRSMAYSDVSDLLKDYQYVSRYEPLTADIVERAVELLTDINSSCSFDEYEQEGTFYFDLICESDRESFTKLMHPSREYNRDFISARFFDLEYTRDLNARTTLSSGEQEMLNLYSALYDATILRPNKINLKKPASLILIDEAEIGYHPEWQRQFVYNLTQFLESLDVSQQFFQVVLTTHSPIILSDIPLSCTNYISKEQKAKPTQETFGANIFDLYHNSFFLQKGMIGEFAMGKIQAVFDLIYKFKSNTDITELERDEAERTIRLIADDVLKEYLTEKFRAADRQRKILCYEERIAKLRASKP